MSATAESHALHEAEGDGTILEHHYDDLEQQHESSMLGMWTFLATEVMFFGGLVGAYIIYRLIYREDFAAAGRHQNVILGGVNTVILLASSLTMALAVRASQLRQMRQVIIYLVATMIFGAGFLGVKAVEYTHDYHEGLMPFVNWNWEKAQSHGGHDEAGHGGEGLAGEIGESNSTLPATPRWFATTGTTTPDPSAASVMPLRARSQSDHAKLYFTFYFFMTGLHAIHLIIGIALVGLMAFLTWRRWFSGSGETQIEVTGLYWHFVDVVWVYLYPALYLIDIHQ